MLQWYDFLSAARGIQSVDDVRRCAAEFTPGYRRMLAGILPDDRNAPIYDAGCGPGLTLSILRELGYRNLEGTDLSATAVAIARASGLRASQANSIDDLSARPDHSFSRIFAVDIIEHMEKADLMSFLKIAESKLQVGGMLLIRCPNGDSPLVGRHLFNDVTHVWTYTSTAISGILMMNGFKAVTFLDETAPFVFRKRAIKLLAMKIAVPLLRWLIRAATLENVRIFAPSFWIVASTN